MSKCTHTEGELQDDGYYDCNGNWVEDVRWVEKGTYEDIDLHRFRCTQCGLIRYYSERARAFYEDGKGDLT